MTQAPPCRPFIEPTFTGSYFDQKGNAWSFMWDGNFLVVTYPDQTVDEFINVSYGTAVFIINAKNSLQAFLQTKPALVPVLMFTENYVDGAWQVETNNYITTKSAYYVNK